MATLTVFSSSVAFADVAPSTWGAVKGLYRGTEAVPGSPAAAAGGTESRFPTLPDPTAATDSILTLSPQEAESIFAVLQTQFQSDVRSKSGGGQGDRIASWSLTNQRILDRSYRDINRNVGVQCKPWVQRVVAEAVGVSVPTTAYGGAGWYWNYSPDVVAWCGAAEYASPGQILQMWLGAWRPHTAIIVGKSPSGMYWIDSNWSWDLTVRLHWISYSYFYSRTSGYFSINQINR